MLTKANAKAISIASKRNIPNGTKILVFNSFHSNHTLLQREMPSQFSYILPHNNRTVKHKNSALSQLSKRAESVFSVYIILLIQKFFQCIFCFFDLIGIFSTIKFNVV